MSDTNTQLPADVVERIDLEAKQYAFYNYVTASNAADFDNIETWPHYAQVAHYSIRHYMIGDLNCWPHVNKTLAMEYATKMQLSEEDNSILKDEIKNLSGELREKDSKLVELQQENAHLKKECERMSEELFQLKPRKRKDIDDL